MKKKLVMAMALIAIYIVAAGADDSEALKTGVEYQPEGTKGGVMLWIPAGKFMMGCNKNIDRDCKRNEKPYHQVELDGYYIDKYEVSNYEYQKCADAGKCAGTVVHTRNDDPRQPVLNLRWEYAETYCQWAGKRLPTEAEWEKAARGDDGRTYPWGEGIDCTKAHYKKCKPWKTMPVGSFPDGASPYGVLDMAGNASEWVFDWYDRNYYKDSPRKNPRGPTKANFHIARGGSFDDKDEELRVSNRIKVTPPLPEMTYYGFRCAHTPHK